MGGQKDSVWMDKLGGGWVGEWEDGWVGMRLSASLYLEEKDIKVTCNSSFIGVSYLWQLEAFTPTPCLVCTPEHYRAAQSSVGVPEYRNHSSRWGP